MPSADNEWRPGAGSRRSRWRWHLYCLSVAARAQWGEMRWSPFVIVLAAVQPTIFLVVIAHVPTGGFTGRVGAVVLTSLWGSTVWSCASVLRADRAYGTLGPVLVALPDPRLLLLARVMAASALSAVIALSVVAVDLGILRRGISIRSPAAFAAALLLAWLSAVGLGGCLACLFVSTRFAPQISSALMYPVFLAGGMLIPPAQLPAFANVLGCLVAFKWAQRALAAAADGEAAHAAWLWLALLTATYFAIGWWLFRVIADRAHVKGTLDVS